MSKSTIKASFKGDTLDVEKFIDEVCLNNKNKICFIYYLYCCSGDCIPYIVKFFTYDFIDYAIELLIEEMGGGEPVSIDIIDKDNEITVLNSNLEGERAYTIIGLRNCNKKHLKAIKKAIELENKKEYDSDGELIEKGKRRRIIIGGSI